MRSGIVLLLLLVGACDSRAPEAISLGTSLFPGHDPLYLAADLHYFDGAAGVRVVEFSSATQVLRAFRNGAVQVAAVTLDETLLLAADIPDLRIVLVLNASNGADTVLGRADIATLADLRGRRIGYEATSLGAYVVSRLLQHAKLTPQQVTLRSMQVDEHERAFRDGEVDALVTAEPTRSRLLAAGAHELFSTRDIPDEIIDVLVVREAFMKDHPEIVNNVLNGWFRALAYLHTSPQDATRRLGARLHTTPEQVSRALTLVTLMDRAANERWFAGDEPPLHAAALRLGGLMRENRLLETVPDPHRFISAMPLNHLPR